MTTAHLCFTGGDSPSLKGRRRRRAIFDILFNYYFLFLFHFSHIFAQKTKNTSRSSQKEEGSNRSGMNACGLEVEGRSHHQVRTANTNGTFLQFCDSKVTSPCFHLFCFLPDEWALLISNRNQNIYSVITN